MMMWSVPSMTIQQEIVFRRDRCMRVGWFCYSNNLVAEADRGLLVLSIEIG